VSAVVPVGGAAAGRVTVRPLAALLLTAAAAWLLPMLLHTVADAAAAPHVHADGPVVDHRDLGPGFATSAAPAFAQAAPVCTGDGVSGHRVQAVYVRSAGDPDRFAERHAAMVSAMADAAGIVRASAAQQSADMTIRYVHDSGCTPAFIGAVVSAAAMADFDRMIEELRAQGLTSTQRTWLLFAESDVECGVAQRWPDNAPGQDNALYGDVSLFARVDRGCISPVTVAHELFHAFGAVHEAAPHSNGYGHCNDGQDVMCYAEAGAAYRDDVCPGNDRTQLDCGHDTYFHPNPPAESYLANHWNTADSPFLAGGGDAGGGGPVTPPPAGPANDAFAAAVALGETGGPVPIDTRGATSEPGEPPIAARGTNSVWYRITPPPGAAVVVDTISDFDPVAAAYTGGGVDRLTSLASDDDSAGELQPRVEFTAPGGTVWIGVAGFDGAQGTGTLDVTVLTDAPPPPPDPEDPPPPIGRDVRRVYGPTRIDTAIALSQDAFTTAADVVIARADGFSDALAGAPLAARIGGPILLTGGDRLDDRVLTELRRLGTSTVHLLGGTAALSAAVEDDLVRNGLATVRWAGASRYDTAAVIASAFPTPDAVHLVDGGEWRTAMIAAAHAARFGDPVLLVDPGGIPAVTADAISRTGADSAIVHDLDGRITSTVYSQAMGLVGTVYANGASTPAGLSAATLRIGPATTVTVATDATFADALAAAALRRPVLLLPGSGPVPADISDVLLEVGVERITVAGGPAAVTDHVVGGLR
jgi:hypothetical protein